MNRNKLKTYAPKARRDFIAAVSARAIKFGVSKDNIEPVQVQGNVALIAGQAHPKKVAEQRAKLEARIKTRGFEQVMEEAAYTWFNRFAAIRYMEVHGYLDHGYRVLSHPEGKPIPEIVEHAQHLDLPGLDMEKVIELKLDGTKEGELYRMLLLAQCNALHAAMPFLFERINDETELLLPDNLLHSDSVIRQLVNEIDEADWQEIEIIGWLYQFYISEKKDQVIGKVVKSEDIPAATQLFTPNWIVKYMVQNTLGAKWLATYPQSGIRTKMEYLIEPAEQTDEVKAKLAEFTPKELNPEEITFLDPACGSGHILVEAYDVFKDIYLERGYSLRDIPRLILEKNLFGLDIDDRAAQMATFALLMKARGDDRRLLDTRSANNIRSICLVDRDALGRFSITTPSKFTSENIGLVADVFHDAKCTGSLTVIPDDISALVRSNDCPQVESDDAGLLSSLHDAEAFRHALFQSKLLSQAYDCVVTNPPYLGMSAMNPTLKEYCSKHYKQGKIDAYAAFILRCASFLKCGGKAAMITMHSWMFLYRFEELRGHILSSYNFESVIHLGARAFQEISGEVVQTAAFVFTKQNPCGYKATFVRALDGSGDEKKARFLDGQAQRHITDQDTFSSIPWSIFAYWVDRSVFYAFKEFPAVEDIAKPRHGMVTSDNARFLREWHEVAHSKLGFGFSDRASAKESAKKWFPYNKGGGSRRWYGCNGLTVNWEHDGRDVIEYARSLYGSPSRQIQNTQFYFKDGITWSSLSSSRIAMRANGKGFLFDSKGNSMFFESEDDKFAIMALYNSAIASTFMDVMAPTLDFNAGAVGKMPFPKLDPMSRSSVISNAKAAISLSKEEWDRDELSWDFEVHPMVLSREATAGKALTKSIERKERINTEIKLIESTNDRTFAQAFGLSEAFICDGKGEIINFGISEAEILSEIQSVISYAVGCMMGRYSLDASGLIYAESGSVGFDPTRYSSFPADDDGIVPITQTDWFDDDAANRFVEFVKVAWSPDARAENLKFVADALGPKGNETPIETIRRYLSTDFFKDHLKTYKKRPIYWLFSSGKEKAFEALVYLHRYNEGTLSRMRMEYVTPLQGRISSRIDQLGRDIEAAASTAAQNKLRKEQEKLKKQQAELIKFDEELRHRADMRINLDLDDGVKVNYGKFGNLLAEVKAITGGSDE